jgi:uncharacterized SAM-binding protein YcdF (DUF218 family)
MVVVKSFTTPLVWVLVLLVLSLILTRPGRRKRLFTIGRWLLLIGTVLLFAFSLNSVANVLAYPLESQYQVPSAFIGANDDSPLLDIVVVLGGGAYPPGPLRPQAELSRQAYPRFYHGVRLFRQSHAQLLAFCGGPIREGIVSEGETMKAMAVGLGIPEEKILAETTSRTTLENIRNLSRLLPAGQNRRIGLVTAAVHMRRAYGVFCRQFPHETVVPIPVQVTYDPRGWDYRGLVPNANNLDRSTVALHEWIGLLWYKLRGR